MKNDIKIATTFLAVSLLSGCATTTTIAENPSSIELLPMEKPELKAQRFYQLDKLKDEERFYEWVNVKDDGTYTGRTSDGCTWEGMGDLISPPFSWKDCGSNPEWIKGENLNLTKKGEIWPLSVGNKVSFSYNQANAFGKKQGTVTRKCKVLGQVNIEVAAGVLDTYKVQCVRHKGNWSRTQVWYFSPEMKSEVKYVSSTSGNGVESDHELKRVDSL